MGLISARCYERIYINDLAGHMMHVSRLVSLATQDVVLNQSLTGPCDSNRSVLIARQDNALSGFTFHSIEYLAYCI